MDKPKIRANKVFRKCMLDKGIVYSEYRTTKFMNVVLNKGDEDHSLPDVSYN